MFFVLLFLFIFLFFFGGESFFVFFSMCVEELCYLCVVDDVFYGAAFYSQVNRDARDSSRCCFV